MRLKIFAIAVCVLLSGCAGQPSGLIGITQPDLYSCAGVPDSRVTLPDREIMEYKQTQNVEGPLSFKGPFSLALDVGGKGTCNAIFTVEDNHVTGVSYSGPSRTLLGPYAACVPLVKGCVKSPSTQKPR